MPDLSNDSMRRVYHGTARLDFTCFDIVASGFYKIGLHFGTRAAAENRNFQKFGDISEVNTV